MEPALKQRLLGAGVLIALAVIFLPMFFSGAPPASGEHKVNLDIPPAPRADMQSHVYEIPVPGAAASNATARPGGVDSSSAAAPMQTLPPAQVTPTSGNDAPPPADQPLPVVDAPAPETQIEAAPKPAPKPAPAKAKPQPPAAHPTAAAPGRAASERYAVSVGVFADRGNAEARLKQVRKLGYDAHLVTTNVDGKRANSVRVGPFKGRASAEAARLKLRDAITGSRPALVIADVAAADKPARKSGAGTSKPATAAGAWAVQLAALRDRASAEKMAHRVKVAGFEAFVDDSRGAHGTWWRVRVGPRAKRADAEKLAARIKADLHLPAIVVAHP